MRYFAASAGLPRRVLLAGLSVLPFAATAFGDSAEAQSLVDPLASWNEGPAKDSIRNFVRATTDKGSPHCVPPGDRIATFDQDGTLWVEHPLYTQAMFAFDRVHALSAQHPEWKSEEPFRAVLDNDMAVVAHFSEPDWAKILAETHAGMSQAAFRAIAEQWLATAKHPRFKRLYTELAYQPMLEVLNYLRANQFETYIVTGGGQDFVRAFSQRVYGIPTQGVIGSSLETTFEVKDGQPELMRMPKLFFNDNFGGKVVGIDLFIGKRPYAAFGNSTGDREMLEWTGAGDGVRLNMLIHHDDADREYAYGPAGGLPDTKVGTFPQSLMDEAKGRGWTVVSMKRDWRRIFPPTE
jgi:phosphoglycolate phosphatase-like HAD superfamily hydrolase